MSELATAAVQLLVCCASFNRYAGDIPDTARRFPLGVRKNLNNLKVIKGKLLLSMYSQQFVGQ